MKKDTNNVNIGTKKGEHCNRDVDAKGVTVFCTGIIGEKGKPKIQFCPACGWVAVEEK